MLAAAAIPASAAAPEPQACQSVRFGLFGYSDIVATTTLAQRVLLQLGYSPRTVDLSIPVIYESLANRDIDVFLGNWMPAQEANVRPYLERGAIEVVAANLEHARFTLAVPHYLYAQGLTDFAAIRRFAGPLNRSIYGIEPGAAANRLMLAMIEHDAFGLRDFKLVESSEQGMLAQLERAYRAHAPIVFVAWEPHPMNLRFHIDYLAGGDAAFGADHGSATINTLTRAGYAAQCPNLGRLLRNLKFTPQGEGELMEAIIDRHEPPDRAADAWLTAHPERLREWLRGVTRFDGAPPSARAGGAGRDAAAGFDGWMVAHKIPVGEAMATFVDRTRVHGSWFFGIVARAVGTLLEGVSAALGALPTFALIGCAAALAGVLRRSWGTAAFVAAALVYILNQGYWSATLETLSLVLVATLLCAVIGIPVGIAGAHHPRFFALLRPLLDLMQTLPAFVYLIPTLVLFGLGPVPGLISTVIFALPAPIRLTAAGIDAVPRAFTEAGQAFGATRRQLLWNVELPAALPMIIAGITQSIMLSLSMVVIAGLVGAGGLGVPVIRALSSVQIGTGFEAGFIIVLLAIILDRLCRPRSRSRVVGR